MERGSAGVECVVHDGIVAHVARGKVLCGIGVALMVFMNREFYSVSNGFGPLGQGIVAFYQRTLGGLSLPVP